MTRLNALNPEQSSGKNKEMFNAINSKLGVVPNMMRTMANSPALLEGYLGLSGALSTGQLGAKLSELIALTVAESNGCSYCLSAHTYLGANLAKLDAKTMEDARAGWSTDSKMDAILKFARLLIDKNGKLSDDDVSHVRSAGVTDSEIAEIIGHVALNILTNYFNNTAGTEIDFPVVEPTHLMV